MRSEYPRNIRKKKKNELNSVDIARAQCKAYKIKRQEDNLNADPK